MEREGDTCPKPRPLPSWPGLSPLRGLVLGRGAIPESAPVAGGGTASWAKASLWPPTMTVTHVVMLLQSNGVTHTQFGTGHPGSGRGAAGELGGAGAGSFAVSVGLFLKKFTLLFCEPCVYTTYIHCLTKRIPKKSPHACFPGNPPGSPCLPPICGLAGVCSPNCRWLSAPPLRTAESRLVRCEKPFVRLQRVRGKSACLYGSFISTTCCNGSELEGAWENALN